MDDAQASKDAAPRLRRLYGRYLPILVIGSLIVGLGIGALIRSAFPSGSLTMLVEASDVLGTLWVNAIRMTVIPLIVPLLIGSIAGARSGRDAGRLGVKTIAAFVLLVAVLAVTAALVAPSLFGGLRIDPTMTAALRASVAETAVPTGDASIGGWLKALVPVNPIKAAADGTMLSIIVFAVAFGFATLAAPIDVRERVVVFSRSVSTIMLIIVQAVLLIAPIGIFALTLVVGARIGGTVFNAMGYFIAVQMVIAAIVILALLTLMVLFGKVPIGKVLRGATPPLLVAAGTSSSLSALPAMIDGVRDVWRLPEKVYGFVLPLAVSTFKPTSGYSWVFNVYFIALLYGVPFGPPQLALAAGYSALFNATIPGIPGGGMIAITPMLLALGLPVEGLAILIAVNPVVDRFTTMGNVAANMALTAILAAHADREDDATAAEPVIA